MEQDHISESTVLSWIRDDPEQRLSFNGGRFTRVNSWCSMLIGAALSAAFYGALLPIRDSAVAVSFFDRGLVPYAIVIFSGWSIAIIILKYLKIRLQRRALQVSIAPSDPQWVLSPGNVTAVTMRMDQAVDDPKKFLLFNIRKPSCGGRLQR